MSPVTEMKANEFKTDLKPVWCPGCGDYGVLSALHAAMAELGLRPWTTVLISGIGCSSRLPGYVKAYGFNAVHGRALTLATGVKIARPELTVIAMGGDGDGLAIGGNHFIHSARRNLDITYILMDNEIYGLTKGQVAPTTPHGEKTKSTFWGNPEPSVDPCEMAISVGATWVARGFSSDKKFLTELMIKAVEHHGFSFLNVMSPCITFKGKRQSLELKEKLRYIPDDHNRADRSAAVKFTRETHVLSTGILYEIEQLSLVDHVNALKTIAKGFELQPTTRDILERFYPQF